MCYALHDGVQRIYSRKKGNRPGKGSTCEHNDKERKRQQPDQKRVVSIF